MSYLRRSSLTALGFVMLALGAMGCGVAGVARDSRAPYLSLYISPGYKSLDMRERSVEFRRAARAESPEKAKELWTAFLKKHYARRWLEDGPDGYKQQVAMIELMRACYHAGDLRGGDGVLATMDPPNAMGPARRRQWSVHSPVQSLTAMLGGDAVQEETSP